MLHKDGKELKASVLNGSKRAGQILYKVGSKVMGTKDWFKDVRRKMKSTTYTGMPKFFKTRSVNLESSRLMRRFMAAAGVEEA
jgi:hypothetical protein